VDARVRRACVRACVRTCRIYRCRLFVARLRRGCGADVRYAPSETRCRARPEPKWRRPVQYLLVTLSPSDWRSATSSTAPTIRRLRVRCTDIVISTLLLLAFYDFIYAIAGERDSASRGQEIRSFFRGESFSERSSPLRTFPASSFVPVRCRPRVISPACASPLSACALSRRDKQPPGPQRSTGSDSGVRQFYPTSLSSYLLLSRCLCLSRSVSAECTDFTSISLSRASLPAWHGKVCCVTCV